MTFIKRALLLLLWSVSSLLAGEAWPGVKFVEARAYAWPDDTETTAVILPGMKLKLGMVNQDGAVLSPDQIKRLRAAVTGRHPDYAVAACYIPHNAVVFYDAEKKPVAFFEICFGCLGTRPEPGGTATWVDFLGLAKIFDELKLPMGASADFQAFKKHFQEH